MFDSPVLNVVIGLALIYLLYSLLTTILGEMLSTSLNLRSVLLRVAIERMLNDGYYRKRRNRRLTIWALLVNVFRWCFLQPNEDFKGSLAGRFYNHPSIKYLAKVERRTIFAEKRPSYLTDVYFVSTLVRLLIEKGLGDDDKSRIASTLQLNTLHMQANTARNIISIYQEAKGDMDAFREGLRKWYNETMDRTNGWYKRKVQMLVLWLGLIISIIFNVDTIRISKMLGNDPKARDQLVNIGIAVSHDSAYALLVRNDDSLQRAQILDSGYKKVQEDISKAQLLLGLGWNFDTLSSKESLEITRQQEIGTFKRLQQAEAEVKSVQKRAGQKQATLMQSLKKIDSTREELADVERSRLQMAAQQASGNKSAQAAVKKAKQRLESMLAAQLALARADSVELRRLDVLRRQQLALVNQLSNGHFRQLPQFKARGDSVIILQGAVPFNGSRLVYIISSTFKDYRLLGFLLTALMLSLGAPFWFDLLKKLIALRGAGIRPNPTEEDAVERKPVPNVPLASSNTVTPARLVVAPPLFATIQDEFVWLHRAGLLALAPVRAVFTFYDATDACKVQINVTDTAGTKDVSRYLARLGVAPPAWIVVKVSGVPMASAMPAHAAGNTNNVAVTHGSLGCYLNDKQNKDRFALSCWHVLRGDTEYDSIFITHPNVIIAQPNSQELEATISAELEAGGILKTLDYGLARCDPKAVGATNEWLHAALELPNGAMKHRAIADDDLKKHAVVRYFDVFSQTVKSGVIYTSSPEVQVDYRDKSRMVQDVLVLMKDLNTMKPISRGGNSGSLLFDSKGDAIGMIIANDANYSYATKLSNFFNLHTEKTFV